MSDLDSDAVAARLVAANRSMIIATADANDDHACRRFRLCRTTAMPVFLGVPVL